jgi:hypothetical protein
MSCNVSRNTLVLFICLTLFSSILHAATKNKTAMKYMEHALHQDAKSIFVGVKSGLSNISFSGFDILFKNHLTPKSALRFGFVDLQITPLETNRIGSYLYDPSSGKTTYVLTKVSDEMYRGGAQIQYLRFFDLSTPQAMYYAVGISGNIGKSKQSRRLENIVSYPTYVTESSAWGIYSRAAVGAEHFTSQNVCLNVEYKFGFGYGYDKTTHENKTSNSISEPVQTEENSKFYFEFNTIEFGLSFYF